MGDVPDGRAWANVWPVGLLLQICRSQIEDPRPRDRYIGEAKRLLAVVDKQLEGQDWIAGEYSIADIAIAPWLRTLDFYGAREVLEWDSYKNAKCYLERFLERPAVQKGSSLHHGLKQAACRSKHNEESQQLAGALCTQPRPQHQLLSTHAGGRLGAK